MDAVPGGWMGSVELRFSANKEVVHADQPQMEWMDFFWVWVGGWRVCVWMRKRFESLEREGKGEGVCVCCVCLTFVGGFALDLNLLE